MLAAKDEDKCVFRMILIRCAGPPKEEVVQGQGYEFPTIPSSFPIRRQRYQEL